MRSQTLWVNWSSHPFLPILSMHTKTAYLPGGFKSVQRVVNKGQTETWIKTMMISYWWPHFESEFCPSTGFFFLCRLSSQSLRKPCWLSLFHQRPKKRPFQCPGQGRFEPRSGAAPSSSARDASSESVAASPPRKVGTEFWEGGDLRSKFVEAKNYPPKV